MCHICPTAVTPVFFLPGIDPRWKAACPVLTPVYECEDQVLDGFLPEEKGPYALTPNTVELIPTLGARRARLGPGPRNEVVMRFLGNWSTAKFS